jgi:uncharacterized membrane protein YraQ (UPF0718 family)
VRIQIFHTFVKLLAESLPLFLIGAAIGALLEVWLKPEWVERWMSGSKHSVFMATVVGAILPGCAVSTIPLAQSLQRRGAAVGTLTAFIMIAPILSPHTVVLTATLISVPMALGRVVLSLVVSLGLGKFLNAFPMQNRATPAAREIEVDQVCCDTSLASVGKNEDVSCGVRIGPVESMPKRFLQRFWRTCCDLTPYLFIGLLIAAVLSAVIPVETIERYLRGGWTAYFFAVVIGIPLYVCDGGEIPLTRALLDMGVGTGPAFCFMLASVGTCFPTIMMASRIIGWKATSIYLVAWIILAVGGGTLLSLLL